MSLRKDPHSCWEPQIPRIRHIAFDLTADFNKRILTGSANYEFDSPLSHTLHMDTRDISIGRITAEGREVNWSLGESNFLGQVLTIEGAAGARKLHIEFSTSPESPALQWLAPEQTAGKKHPYMFSQCQAILARSVFPCQDTPSVRFTYDAVLRVPRGLSAVMAAKQVDAVESNGQVNFRFRMPHPIPSYLFALAVGHITSDRIGTASRVFAEPELIRESAHEFGEVDSMISGARGLYGDYVWGEFNLLVMPPSFPYGGMENPTLTFLTPTLIAGDRSLVAVVAHELAHSWTGNLVTNATWEDFWLNEGWTVYAERRIVEKIYGTEQANLQAVNGRNDLMASFKNFGDKTQYTKLRTNLDGVDPDEVFSSVPYEKGFLLLVALERAVGRTAWDKFVRAYIHDFQFTSITTDDFIGFLKKHFPDITGKVNLARWIDEPGLPDDAPEFSSKLIDDVRIAQKQWRSGVRNLEPAIENWDVQQKVLFLEELDQQQSHDDCRHIARLFDVEKTRNTEILLPWYCIAAASTFEPAFSSIDAFLSVIGRGKYLRPLYRALYGNPETKAMAASLFHLYKDRYHSVSRASIARILSA